VEARAKGEQKVVKVQKGRWSYHVTSEKREIRVKRRKKRVKA